MGRNPALISTSEVNIDRAIEIDGWMDDFELEWLATQARSHSRIVEVGSYKGRSTRALAENTPGWVLAFDDWQGPRDQFYEDGKLVYKDFSNLYCEFENNVYDLMVSGKIRVLRGNHQSTDIIPIEFLLGHDEDKPDMVFIDGGHEYDETKRDILIWKHRLAKGGLLCGHDSSWDGVFQAVVEVLGSNWEVEVFTDIWRAHGL